LTKDYQGIAWAFAGPFALPRPYEGPGNALERIRKT